ncbi:MAG: YiiX/YebB-like N1pC/P60 family cysteine hydrolase [Anaerolineae bacterium]|jgi:uncharacterized protein YycO
MELHIAVTYGEGLLGKLARWYGLMWSHAALRYVREGSNDPRIIESAACGVRERSWWDLVAESTEYKVYRVKEGLPEVTKREIVAYGWGNVGKPYNYWWLVKIAWRLVTRRLLRVLTYPAHVCSSLVYDCFLYAGVDLIPGQTDVLVTPDDLANSPLLEEVESA